MTEESIESMWTQFDIIRQNEFTLKNLRIAGKNDLYICTCGGKKVLNCDEMPTCTSCGAVVDLYITDTAEWASGVDDAGKVTDHSRCGAPQDLELFSSHWGSSTTMFKPGKQSYAQNDWPKSIFTCP